MQTEVIVSRATRHSGEPGKKQKAWMKKHIKQVEWTRKVCKTILNIKVQQQS